MEKSLEAREAEQQVQLVAGDLSLRCRILGSGPVVVAIGVALGRCAEALAGHYRLLLLEPELSGAIAAPVPLAQALGAALDQLGIARFNLLAGATLLPASLRLAAMRADRVDAVVLIGPPNESTLEEDARILAGTDLPVLAIAGTRGVASPPAASRQFRAALKNCHLVLVYDAGDAPAEERPEAVADVVTDFLARHERFIVNAGSGVVHP